MAPPDDKPATDGGSAERTDVISKVRVLSGKYRLGRLLGEGGMGAVYEAEHTGLEAKVAIKLLSEGGSLDHKALARFRREARAMGAIRHENVVTVLDTGADEEGVPYLVMELLEGESLASMLRRERQIAPALAIWITSQVLSGLTAAHAKGVVHRDLKPGNVFIARQADGSHKVKILDFGISKVAEVHESMNVTADGALVGTPNFMAPEQITGSGPIDGRVDIYAVGVLLYRMVTGRLPFVGKTSDELYRKILAGQPVPPRRRQPDVPQELEEAILKALSLERDARYPDCGAFREALQQIARNLTGDLPPLPTTMPHGEPHRAPPSLHDISRAETVASNPAIARRSSVRSNPATLLPPAAATRRTWLWLAGAVAVLVAGGATVVGVLAAKQHEQAQRRGGAPLPRFDGPPLRYGIQRYSSVEEVTKAHQPILDYLSRYLKRPVELVIKEDETDIRNELMSGRVDLAALSPYSYVRARKVARDLPLLAKPVTPGGSSYQGLILTRADSGIERLDQLRGKRFCYVRPGSTSGYLYPRALLRQASIDPDKDVSQVIGGDHLSTLRTLDRGGCEAAAVYAKILETGEQENIPADRFHMLASTDRIPYDAYVVRRDMKKEEREKIQAALLSLEPGSDAARVLVDRGAAGEIIGFARAADADYEGVRRIEHLLDDAQGKRP